MLNISQNQLRQWESRFKELRPTFTAGGTRKYQDKDIEVLKTIIHLLNTQKLKIEGAAERMSKSADWEQEKVKALEKLKTIKSELIAIRHEINATSAMAEDTIVD